ncbi:DUF748 domain-containing protein [Mucisphaera calidilacus]|uniref:AsmA-like C-terminal domain-containing protein n=1 Tax=Mucisphaera calidilacus TaxID=2527982 RepID=A0A518BZS8_9BACT|nr:hypothetical protein [Mucisphaera calidilacus]QDU72475.1 hypothetical protein Pan265_23410 [Mucisphaera calidilacus]
MPLPTLLLRNRLRSLGKLRRANRWRRVVALVLLVVLSTAVLIVITVTNPAILTPLITAIANAQVVSEVRIERASVDFRRLNLQIDGIRLLHRRPDQRLEPVLEADRILIRPDWSGLIWGEAPVRSILVIRPVLHIIEDREQNANNLESIAERRREEGRSSGGITSPIALTLPEVYLRAGEIRFAVRDENGQRVERSTIPLTGHVARRQDAYQFILKQSDVAGQENVEITGAYMPRDAAFRLQIRDFNFEHPISYAFPARIRAWWASMKPSGRVPSTTVVVRNDGLLQINASMFFDDIALTLPAIEDSSLRMTSVNGAIHIDQNRPSAEIEGSIEGIRYRVVGHVDDLTPDAAFSVTVSAPPFQLPDDPQIIDALPDVGRNIYDNLDPSGWLSLDLTLERPGPGEPLDYRGTVTAHDAGIRYFRFAYPMQNVTGEIRFSPEAVDLVNLKGVGPTGARASLEGRIAPVGPDPAVSLDVSIDQLPIDAYLFGALNEGSQNAIRLFFDADHYETLRNAGRIDSPPMLPEHVIPPGLGGTVDADFTLRRPYGPDQPALTATRVETRGLKGLLKHWPYPLVSEGGVFELATHWLRIEGIDVKGPTGATARVTGDLDREDSTGRLRGTVLVSAARAPIDAFLLKAIPGNAGGVLAELHPTGWITAETRIHLSMEEPVAFEVAAQIEQASVRPYTGTYLISDMTGGFEIDNQSVTVRQLTGKHGGTTFDTSGYLSWSDPESLVYQATIDAKRLILEPGLADLFPPGTSGHELARSTINERRPSGQLDLLLNLDRRPDEPSLRVEFEIEPQRLAFTANDYRFDVTDMTGSITYADKLVRIDEVTASTEGGRVAVDGRFTTDFTQLNLAIDAHDDHISGTTRALLPAALNAFIDGFELAGGYDFRGTVARTPAGGDVATTVEGRLDLKNASITPGIAIRNANAGVLIDVRDDNSAPWPAMNLDIAASSMIVADRETRRTTLRVSNEADRQRLRIEDILGDMAGGTLAGQASTDLGEDGWYRMGIELVDVDLSRFLITPDLVTPTEEDLAWMDEQLLEEQGVPQRIESQRRRENQGLMSASLYLEGQHERPESRLGRGDIDATKVGLLNQPLGLTILRAFNFTMPSTRSLDSASIRFLLEGDNIRFDGIEITAPDFAIIGAGTMQFETQQIDLALFSRSRQDLGIGVQGLFNNIRDQIACLRVQGSLEKPTTNLSFFPGITASLKSTVGIEEIPPYLEHLFSAEDR